MVLLSRSSSAWAVFLRVSSSRSLVLTTIAGSGKGFAFGATVPGRSVPIWIRRTRGFGSDSCEPVSCESAAAPALSAVALAARGWPGDEADSVVCWSWSMGGDRQRISGGSQVPLAVSFLSSKPHIGHCSIVSCFAPPSGDGWSYLESGLMIDLRSLHILRGALVEYLAGHAPTTARKDSPS